MSVYLYLHTDTSYEAFENINELKITQVLNDHGYLHLTAIVQESAKADYATSARAYELIEVVVGDETNVTPIFKGLVQHIEIKQLKNCYLLEVKAATCSFRTDLELRSRSFQAVNMTYSDILKGILQEYTGGDLNDEATKGATLGKFTMQYRETDWQFLKRMASRFNACIVPSLVFDCPKITIGKPKGTFRDQIEKYNFYVTKNLEQHMKLTSNNELSALPLDAVTFHIETNENFEIGDELIFSDKSSEKSYVNIYIKRKEIEMVNGALRFRYELCGLNGLACGKIFNEQIVGLSLKGKVLSRINDKVKVHLEIDDSQAEAVAWPFPYTTPYTAEGSGGWYVMPEVGDTVLIYFPNKEEDCGVGMNSVRVLNTGTDRIGTPEIKYLRTIDGKELKLAPSELMLTCSNWKNPKTGEQNIIYIRLNADGGITIQSTKPIHICSDADINITADRNLFLAAENEIRLKCKSSLINMDSSIKVESSAVIVN